MQSMDVKAQPLRGYSVKLNDNLAIFLSNPRSVTAELLADFV